MARSTLSQWTLSDLRCYARPDLALDGLPVFLFGAIGAGKTKVLEAVSFREPGEGLRDGRCGGGRVIVEPGEGDGRDWAVSALVRLGDRELRRRHWRRGRRPPAGAYRRRAGGAGAADRPWCGPCG